MKVRRVDFSPDEWLGGTVLLNNAERGLYITACALIYSAGEAVSEEHLRAACRDHGNAFNRQLDRLIELGKLSINDGQISNKRAINELENAAKRTTTARENVGKRWKNKALNGEVVIQGGNANHQPSTINHQPNSAREAREDFINDFWKDFPSQNLLRPYPEWMKRLAEWAEKPNMYWPELWGPRPSHPNCDAPRPMLEWASEKAAKNVKSGVAT